MSLTINSGTQTITPVQFLARYDGRTVGDLVSDDGTNHAMVGSPPVYTPSVLYTNETLLLLLQEAMGEVESACLVANRYQPSDLANLLNQNTGVTDAAGQPVISNSAQKLVGMVAGIAMFYLWDRRPARLLTMSLPLRAQKAMEDLELLRQGERIFGFSEAAAAGNPQPQFMTPNDLTTRNFASVQMAAGYFGRRAQFNVPGRGNAWSG